MEFSKMRMSEMVYFPEPVFNIIKDFLWGLPTKAHPAANLIFIEFTDQMIYFCTTEMEGAVWEGRSDELFADKGLFPFSSILDATKNSKKRERSTWCKRLCKYPNEDHLYKMLLHSRELKKRRAAGEQLAPTLIEIMTRINIMSESVRAVADHHFQCGLVAPKIQEPSWSVCPMRTPQRLTCGQLKTYLKENGIKFNKKMKKKVLVKMALSF